MAHRLITSMRRVDRILKFELKAVNFNIFAQVQTRSTELRQFLSQSSVYSLHEALRGLDKPSHPKRGNNGGAEKMKGNGTGENKQINMRTNNGSSKSPPKSAPKTSNQDFKSGGNCSGGGDGKKGSRHVIWVLIINYKDSIFVTVVVIWMGLWLRAKRTRDEARLYSRYEEITWKDYFDNYWTQGRVANIEVVNKKWLRVQTAPGASGDVAKTVLVKIDSLDSYRSVAPAVAPVGESTEMRADSRVEASVVCKKKVQPERDISGVHQKHNSSLRSRLFCCFGKMCC